MKKFLLGLILLVVFGCGSFKIEERSYNIIKGYSVINDIKVKKVDVYVPGYNVIEKVFKDMGIIECDQYDIIIYTENDEIILIKLNTEN